ncbi:6840_t:CDS:2 [Racocetra persica]|uniref:6840_t:CDS:1 n=1 Tax=Racocetra persica TaxID=160502 RepID=A0ACA9K9V3_9GLOM|nr:6840_t:CDS:2 [Racocetra persica]
MLIKDNTFLPTDYTPLQAPFQAPVALFSSQSLLAMITSTICFPLQNNWTYRFLVFQLFLIPFNLYQVQSQYISL